MNKKVYLYRASSWLKHQLTAWNTGGEGVHSPYLFEWVRMVMCDAHAYNIWKDIEQIRKRMLKDERMLDVVDYGSGGKAQGEGGEVQRRVRDIARGSLTQIKYAQMMFRMVNWLGHQLRSGDKGLTIVELGTSLGITTAYLAGVDSRDRVYTYEGSEAVANVAKENWKALAMNNIVPQVGAIAVADLKANLTEVDIAFIDANHTYDATLAYFDVLADKVHQKSILIVDDIHHSAAMQEAWEQIISDKRVTSTIDLYQMGLVFFDKHYWPRNYRMRFGI